LDRCGRPTAVWVGENKAVRDAAEKHLAEHWTTAAPAEKPDLVVAAVCPSQGVTDWTAMGRVLENAAQIAASDAKIVLSAAVDDELGRSRGKSGRWLVDQDNPHNVIARLRPPEGMAALDSVATNQIAWTLARHEVYLHSRAPDEFVESLGMEPAAACYVFKDADQARVASG
ncbi:MAG: hypothetical protein ACRC1K_07850, partial [Planctomycetia bacterium]